MINNKESVVPSNFIRQIIDNDLKNGIHKSIHTRFPPEPNGYLHIGHAKSICLNFGIAKDYLGKCNLRFDDTNPEKEDLEYIKSIKNDLIWLGFKWSGDIHYSSNYFDEFYKYAIELINKGLAYVDELNPKQIREYRGTLSSPGKPSPYRSRSIQKNLDLFKKMRLGKFKEGEACLRAKIDMNSSFIIMRDPVLYRIRFIRHQQTGNNWCIYPMYDFSHCISDALEGITHSICTLEFQDNRRLYDWILDNITITCRPNQYEFSRLNLQYTIMSKRKLNQLVKSNLVEGWDDPRMPTISGLRRRGFTAKAIRDFCQRVGVTKQENMIEFSSLESCIRADLNKTTPRVMAVLNPVKVIIENYNEKNTETLLIRNHPNKPEMGFREVPFGRVIWIERNDFREIETETYKRLVLGQEVRLRGSYIIRAKGIKKDKQGKITTIYCSYDMDSLGKNPNKRKVKRVIHWISADKALIAEIRLYDHLFTIPNPDSVDDFINAINSKSLCKVQGFVEPSLATAKPGQRFQFERIGYFCLDSKHSKPQSLVFNRTVSLRETWSFD
ncbi:glutaminyl-tRNA synthetase [Candidatus Photodesmus katoptron]|uniref:glutamine--tRNA ligase n=1 Tax=Candidatus Photodesmus anomalopis TaxID=28176 RepID=UPI0004D58217|nr:glutamine--tRNA ligase [Candidatus Photodesmus katoptron]KEY90593.1 glutaminyl-tRNA synthetase [Candidatus Photodesmus katoptron]